MAGIILAILSAIAFGTSQAVVRIGLQNIRKVSTANLITILASLITTLIFAVILDFPSIVSISLASVVSFTIVGILNFPLARQFSYLGTRYIGVTRSYPLTATHPLFAMIIATLFLKEKITLLMIIGVLLIIGGISIFARQMDQDRNQEIKYSP